MVQRNAIIWRQKGETLRTSQRNAAALRKAGYELTVFEAASFDDAQNCAISSPADYILIEGLHPEVVLEAAPLKAGVIWDLSGTRAAEIRQMMERSDDLGQLRAALCQAETVINLPAAVRVLIEKEFAHGLPRHDLTDALVWLQCRTIVVVGSGLGNMMNATPVIRWIAERQGAPVDVVIHQHGPQAVELFCNSPWVHNVYPDYGACAGRHYTIALVTAIAAHLEPTFSADRWIPQHKLVDYNIDSRTTMESELYLVGLRTAWPDAPVKLADLPPAFLRDANYVWKDRKIVGVANGIKTGVWAKRQWPHVQQLIERLSANGWAVRLFGMPEEYLPGAEDYTGLSIRDTITEIGECAYFIGHDGGITHLAETLGVPTLWLFGPTAIRKNGPLREESRVVTSGYPCSPCNFRVDWARCETAPCMATLSVDQVMSEFEGLQVAVKEAGPTGWNWRPFDPVLAELEFAAQYGPSQKELADQILQERTALLPRDDSVGADLLLNLARSGDIRGLSTVCEFYSQHFPENAVFAAISASIAPLVAALDDKFEVPFCGAAPASPPPVDVIAAATRLGLDRKQMILLIELLVNGRLLSADRDRRLAVRDLMSDLLKCVPPELELGDRLMDAYVFLSGKAMHANDDGSPLVVSQKTGLQPSLPAREGGRNWPHWLSAQPARDIIDNYAEDLAFHLGQSPNSIIKAGFAPSLKQAPSRPVPIRLVLSGRQHVLTSFDAVLVIADHIAIDRKSIGSLSSYVTWVIERLAGLTLRPFVVNLAPTLNSRAAFFRDNVTYFMSSPSWKASDWSDLLDAVAPALILRVGDQAAGTDLPLREGCRIEDFAVDGLYDPTGIVQNLSPNLGWWAPGGVRTLTKEPKSVSELSRALMVPDRVRQLPRMRQSLRETCLVFVNNDRDLTAFLKLALATPQVHFTVISDAFDRSCISNVSFERRGSYSFGAADLADFDLVVQFSRRPSDLAAELLRALESGATVIAAREFSDTHAKAVVVSPRRPDRLEDWREVVLDQLSIRARLKTQLLG